MALGPHALVAALPFHNLLLFTLFLPRSLLSTYILLRDEKH